MCDLVISMLTCQLWSVTIAFVSLKHAALGLLAQQPGSGYDLLKQFQLSMANVWPATQSQLYGELNKLAERGLIEVSSLGPRGRKEYAITDAGRAELRRWMTAADDDPPYRSVSLLRVFLLSELSPDEAVGFLESWRESADDEHARFAEMRDAYGWDRHDADFYGRAALEYGLRSNQMEAEWATWVIEAIEKRQRQS